MADEEKSKVNDISRHEPNLNCERSNDEEEKKENDLAADDGGARKKSNKKKKKNKSKDKRKEKEIKKPIDTGGAGDENEVAAKTIAIPPPPPDVLFEKLSLKEAIEFFHQGPAKNYEEAMRKHYAFWDTQPVPKMTEKVTTNDSIEGARSVTDIRNEPYSLPEEFLWDTLEINDPLILKELYTLLNENYVEDDDNMFRFDYSPDFLKWALQAPEWNKNWHVGVRVAKSKKLVGFISAVPANIRIYERELRMVEINFLCVHKKLRMKRVAPVLIREITRRVNLVGIFQAVYTAGVVLPKPVSSCRYWHRSLNPRKLIDVKFSHLSRNMTMQRTLKLFKLPETTKTEGFRKMTVEDVKETHALLLSYLKRFDLSPVFTEEEFRHWFIPRENIVDSYIVDKGGEITDFVSFYTLPSTVMHHPMHKSLKAAYSFYNVSFKTPWIDLIGDALIVAKNDGFDVFNALDLMENREFLEKLKFGVGDGNLQYYLYNWKCPSIPPHKVGLVLQ